MDRIGRWGACNEKKMPRSHIHVISLAGDELSTARLPLPYLRWQLSEIKQGRTSRASLLWDKVFIRLLPLD